MPGGVQGITPTTGVLVEDSEVYRDQRFPGHGCLMEIQNVISLAVLC